MRCVKLGLVGGCGVRCVKLGSIELWGAMRKIRVIRGLWGAMRKIRVIRESRNWQNSKILYGGGYKILRKLAEKITRSVMV